MVKSRTRPPKIFLQELPYGGEQPVILDSTTLQDNGNFELRAVGTEETLYRLVIENGPDVLLVNDGKSIRLNLDVNNFQGLYHRRLGSQ